jgi:beta-1,4-mannosyltransferase
MSSDQKDTPSPNRIAVIVMGDVDRSPRMINHALSVANLTSYNVDLIGYRGSSLPEAVENNKKIRTRYLSTAVVDTLRKLPKAFYLLYAILRILIQVL